MTSRARRLATAAGVLAAALAPCALVPTHASAGTYAYWSYWHDTGSGWKYSGCGAYYSQGDCVPADGTIDGWRFTVSSEGGAKPPRYSSGFAQACASTTARDGVKRVAIVVDYGTQADASSRPVAARCATGAPGDNGGALLDQQFSIQASEGFVCRIESYPKSGCGDYIPDSPSPKPTATKTSTSTSSPAPPHGPAQPTPTAAQEPIESPGSAASQSAPPRATPTTTPTDLPTPDTSSSEAPAPVVFGGAPSKSSSGSPVGTLVGIAVIAAGAGAAVVVARRRRSE